MRFKSGKNNNHINRKGFSLAETLFAVGLMTFVASAAIGGMVVIQRVKETVDKQAKANMVMIATVCYLREDLNNCTNPTDMDCSVYYVIDNNDIKLYGPVFFNMNPASDRYLKFKVRNASGSIVEDISALPPKVQYWNSSSGICVGVVYSSISGSVNGVSVPMLNRKYILAQNVMEGTGMYSLIGDGTLAVGATYYKGCMGEAIDYDESTKLFTFWVYVIEEGTNEVIMKQKVEVCPEYLMPAATTTNP